MLSKPIEQIKWIDVDDELPDEELLVLIFAPADGEPVSFGYLEGGEWYGPNTEVIAWAELPLGPGRIKL